ncbi:hypothetical protein N7448_010278 [Penicillium atrosanguineum]|uniref:IEC3 subunit of the Ino80 complex, chromatin re-modelling-domain-containing protein n=1 Tax=Penicillium atrosanguineum TaxID=1132637 RepID=A0A9W9GGS6_9EURO|nr:uncharacterized protein N7443_007503 [Penicillium atrosanguineum]KAJ5118570.1 hypothetical protein N7526_010207 [Penicillium atrosanguineum]KAJ5119609.1 hypothetical protein N7448_010278 [Penicillium atrosanguineum]KAJ5296610.1 hypothetical protein N7443_007503 [Penicillium atrosanguineum]KAJ5299373.1 hypothetical protein N7476_010930 [Penicillium atrosanguineum]
MASETLPDAPAAPPVKQSVRSFKKKYAKTKVKFELGTRENETLIREELRIEDLSKRIQEQNDQLLEVLLEFNESIHVSPTMRFDLNMPGDIPSLSASEQEIAPLVNDATLARTALKEAKAELAGGNLSASAFRQVEQSIKRNKEFAPSMQYSNLSQVPHTNPIAPDQEKGAGAAERKLGYFTPEHETEYYLALDAKLGDEAAALQLGRVPDPPTFAERERDASIRNPASVYNWLRRNQPQTLQDHEVASEKSASRPSNQRASKRAPVQRKEEDKEVLDEDGADAEPTPKNKRKRDEDTGYRPKGGSSRPKKKKEESTPTANRSAKKT